jgi:hypothetical protein
LAGNPEVFQQDSENSLLKCLEALPVVCLQMLKAEYNPGAISLRQRTRDWELGTRKAREEDEGAGEQTINFSLLHLCTSAQCPISKRKLYDCNPHTSSLDN